MTDDEVTTMLAELAEGREHDTPYMVALAATWDGHGDLLSGPSSSHPLHYASGVIRELARELRKSAPFYDPETVGDRIEVMLDIALAVDRRKSRVAFR